MTDQLPLVSKLAHNIGLIVLQSQQLERNLKLIVAAMDQPATTSVIQRHEELRRRSLGEIVKRFLANVTVSQGNVADLQSYFQLLLDRRNNVVHHFAEVYGEDLAAGNHTEVLASLAKLHGELRHLAMSFRGVNQAFLESLQEEPPLAENSFQGDAGLIRQAANINMLIREYILGEEAILRDVFQSSVHQLARPYYTDEQIDAWAPATYDPDKWRDKMATNRPFVAIIGSRIAGYADLQASGHIDHFFVSPEFARRGVGSGLMRHIHDVARERGVTRLCADVSLAAEAFFTRHGFVVDRRQSVSVGGVVLSNAHMVKEAIGDKHGDG